MTGDNPATKVVYEGQIDDWRLESGDDEEAVSDPVTIKVKAPYGYGGIGITATAADGSVREVYLEMEAGVLRVLCYSSADEPLVVLVEKDYASVQKD